MNTTPFSTLHFTSTTPFDGPRSDQDQLQVDAIRRVRAAGQRALVLGGGGSAGNAWLIGVITGLFDAGLDVTEADLIIGTSAGSTAAAHITSAPDPTACRHPFRSAPATDWSGNATLRRLIIGAVLCGVVVTTVLTVLYYLLPLDRPWDSGTAVRLVIGLLVFTGLTVWQVKAITGSRYPGLRAAEALGLIIPLYLLLFASTYFLMERASAATFTQSLTRTGPASRVQRRHSVVLRVAHCERRTSLTASAVCWHVGQWASLLRSCWRRDARRGGRSRNRRFPAMPLRTVAAGPTCGARVTV